MKLSSMIAAAVTAALLPLSASATTELVTNGGFETNDLTGWTCTGASLCDTVGGSVVYSGSYGLYGYDNDGFATLSQTIDTEVGATYDFSFWSRTTNLLNEIRYSLDGGAVQEITETLTFSQTTDSFVASGTSAVISVFFETDPGTGVVVFDDISVTLGEAAPAVPLPASAVLLMGAVAGLGAYGRRRAKG